MNSKTKGKKVEEAMRISAIQLNRTCRRFGYDNELLGPDQSKAIRIKINEARDLILQELGVELGKAKAEEYRWKR